MGFTSHIVKVKRMFIDDILWLLQDFTSHIVKVKPLE